MQNHDYHHQDKKLDHPAKNHKDHNDQSEHQNKKDQHDNHKKSSPDGQSHSAHHGHMIKDFKRRFWVSLIITIPIIAISPMIHHFLGLEDSFRFTGDMFVLFALSSVVTFMAAGRF
jgi:Cu2+-exporting ATPase